MRSRMFTAPSTLPDDPPTLQLILRAALAEIDAQPVAASEPEPTPEPTIPFSPKGDIPDIQPA